MTAPETQRPSPRLLVWTVVGIGCMALSLWLTQLVVSTIGAGVFAAYGTQDLQTSLAAAQSGDTTAASSTAASANQSFAIAQGLVHGPAFTALGVVPVVSSLSDDIVNSVDAATDISSAAGDGFQLLAATKGTGGQPPIFANGAFNLAQLKVLAGPLNHMDESLGRAEAELTAINSIPGFARIRSEGLAKIAPVRRDVAAVNAAMPLLADGLGAHGPKNYLVAILNPAELFPTGGAPLSVMVLRFDNGKMTRPISGQVSSTIFPSDDPTHDAKIYYPWSHLAGKPFYDSANAPSFFVNSNTYPDFRVSGEEMARAWQAGGKGKVDGVITIDASAIAAILDKSGPVALADGQELTSANLAQKVLIDPYVGLQKPEMTQRRHAENDALMQQLATRLTSGQSMPAVVRALLAVAPGRHFQAYLRNPQLQDQVAKLDIAGGLSTADGDYGSFFTTSSPNKVAVFQQRSIDREIRLAADGSATVTEKIEVRNTAPASDAPLTGRGYNDRRAQNLYMVYLPDRAEHAALAVSGGVAHQVTRPSAEFKDLAGRRFLWNASAADPGQADSLKLTYSLPAGTFSTNSVGATSSSELTYRSTIDPQPMWNTAQLSVTVIAPTGYSPIGDENWQRSADSYTRSVGVDSKLTFVLSLSKS